jgi:cold-inducible RNA-binding protein
MALENRGFQSNWPSHARAAGYSKGGRFDDVRALIPLESAPSLAFPTWQATILATSDSTRKAEFGRHFFAGRRTVGMKLYVGNLSYDTTNSSLEELFVPFGSVRSAQVIQDRDTGRSKGFGFVEMADDNAARTAIAELNEKDFGGRPLTVNEAKPREDRGSGERRGNYSRR